MNNLFRPALLIVFLFCFGILAKAQVGREFWFVAPEATNSHGDKPIYFRITTFNTGTNITIEFPANPGFNPIKVYIPANTQYTTDENAFELDDIENRPSNTILNKGIRITAHDADVSAYYEIAHTGNPDKFTLKGRNALGTEFFIPSQNSFRNNNRTPIADEKVDIVATVNDTEVIIVPTVDVVGHNKGDTIKITLDAGQTFCVENTDISKTSSMAGTYVQSNNPIAITISDDSIHNNDGGSAHDMIGDQLIPVNVIGTEYVIVNTSTDHIPGNWGTTLREVYITATEDGTVIYKNGGTVVERSLNRGESTQMTITPNNMYIEANKPIYVYQLASMRFDGDGNEIGSSLLPHANCTGSDVVTVKRIFDNEFFLQLMVKGKDRASFSIKDEGGATLDYLDNVVWHKVTGTDANGNDEAWYTSNIQLSDKLSSDKSKVYFIQNTGGLFHLSILEENRSSVSYGYFSSFSNLNVNGLTEGCKGDHILLSTLEPMKSYEWYSDVSGGNTLLSDTQQCEARETGKYWVRAEVVFGGCILTDSIDVVFNQPEIDLGGDTLVCPGEVLTFGSDELTNIYDWSDGTNSNYTNVTVTNGYSGTLSVTITDSEGCSNTDDVTIGAFSVPDIDLDMTTVCEGGRVSNVSSFTRYEWSLNGTVLNTDPSQNYIDPTVAGTYQLTAWTADGCSVTESFTIQVNPLPTFTITDQMACSGLVQRIDGPVGAGFSYNWNTGENTASIDINTPGDYWLEVEDANGCEYRQDFSFDYHLPIPIDLGPDRDECAQTTLNITNSSEFSNFTWAFVDGSGIETILPTPTPEYEYEISNAQVSNSGTYKVEATDVNGCKVNDEVVIGFYDTNPPPLNVDRELCQGETIDIITSDGYDSYTWTRDGNPIPGSDNLTTISVTQQGTYVLTATYLTCVKTSNIQVIQHDLPSVQLPADFNICPDTEGTVTVANFTGASTGGALDYIYWNGQSNLRYNDWTTAELDVNSAGNYTVTAVDEHGCISTDAITIGIHSIDAIPAQGPFTTCENIGEVLQNLHPSTRTYTWSKIENSTTDHLIDNADYLAQETGSYQLQIEDNNGCLDADTIVVIANPVPSVNLGPDVAICQFETLQVEVEEDYAQYRWNDDPSLNTKSITADASGTYKLEVANSYGCWAEDEMEVVVNPAPVFTLGNPGPECPGYLYTLNGPPGMAEYHWSTFENTQTVEKYDGTYSLRVVDVNGCEFSDTVTLTNHPITSVSLGPDTTICPLFGDFELDAGPGFASYSWSTGENTQTKIADIFEAINSVTVTNSEGCIDADDILVINMEPPVLEILDDAAVCDLDSIQLDATGDDLIEWEWSNGSTDPNPWVKVAGEYILRANDGCVWMADTMELVVHETPVVSRIDTTIYAQVVIYPTGGTEPYQYAMNDGAYQDENVFRNLENGEYTFWVEDNNGCLASELVTVFDVLNIDIPNFFTPNGDGYNDTWNLSGFDRVPDSIIKIYDRYGKLLKKYKVSEPAWDGTYLGKPLRTDDYWYVIELIPINKTLKGHLTLKR